MLITQARFRNRLPSSSSTNCLNSPARQCSVLLLLMTCSSIGFFYHTINVLCQPTAGKFETGSPLNFELKFFKTGNFNHHDQSATMCFFVFLCLQQKLLFEFRSSHWFVRTFFFSSSFFYDIKVRNDIDGLETRVHYPLLLNKCRAILLYTT